MTLRQGPQQLTLVNYGPAHTDGDTVVYVSAANVAVVGDIFSNHFYPIIDLASGGSIDGVIHSLDEILARTDEQTKIVPGHGPVATRGNLEEYRDMLVQVRQRIVDLIAAGKTIDEAVAPQRQRNSSMLNGVVVTYPRMFLQRWYSAALLTAAVPVGSHPTPSAVFTKLIEREYIRRGAECGYRQRLLRSLAKASSSMVIYAVRQFRLA